MILTATSAILRRAAGSLCLLIAGAAWSAPLPLQGLSLVDQRSRSVVPALEGRVVLLSFLFTQCSSVCPGQTMQLARVYARLPAPVREHVRFVSVSVDPLTDTPQTLAAYARRLQADRPGWHFATGKPAEVFDLAQRMRVLLDRQGVRSPPQDHRTSLFLFRPDGQLVQRYRGDPVDEPRLADEIAVLTGPQFINKPKPAQ